MFGNDDEREEANNASMVEYVITHPHAFVEPSLKGHVLTSTDDFYC